MVEVRAKKNFVCRTRKGIYSSLLPPPPPHPYAPHPHVLSAAPSLPHHYPRFVHRRPLFHSPCHIKRRRRPFYVSFSLSHTSLSVDVHLSLSSEERERRTEGWKEKQGNRLAQIFLYCFSLPLAFGTNTHTHTRRNCLRFSFITRFVAVAVIVVVVVVCFVSGQTISRIVCNFGKAKIYVFLFCKKQHKKNTHT